MLEMSNVALLTSITGTSQSKTRRGEVALSEEDITPTRCVVQSCLCLPKGAAANTCTSLIYPTK